MLTPTSLLQQPLFIMGEINQDGLRWDYEGLGIAPVWTREPSTTDIEAVCRQRLQVQPSDACTISFFAEGAYNKLYLVETGDKRLLIRVSLPVCPRHKTCGEVTTLRWLREHTTIPVPTVVDFDERNDNKIGFEWILMELLPGMSCWRRWRGMSMAQKVFLTQRIAEFQAQLLRHGSPGPAFRGVGTLESSKDGSFTPTPAQFVSDTFFMGDHIKYDVPRGPFRSSHDWLLSCLKVASLEHEAILANPEMDDDDKESAGESLVLAKRLLALLPKIFPSIQEPHERTALWHHDLGLNNILVNHQGENTAVIDWEGVSAVPLWMAAQVPKFLRGSSERGEEPRREIYADEPPPPTADDPDDPDELDNEGKNQLYWIHLMEYETTQLRKIYHDKLRCLWPEWDLHVAEGRLKRDFHEAVVCCVHGLFVGRASKWVDKIEAGEFANLHPDQVNG